MRVVIADDVDTQRQMVAAMLRAGGHEIVAACDNGRAAIDAVKATKPDVVILDHAMLRMTGTEAAREIAKLDSPPIIVLATNAPNVDIEETAAAVGGRICRKPFKTARLLEVLANG